MSTTSVNRRQWWIWSLVLVVLLVLAANARFTNDLRSMLPTSDPHFTRELDFFTEQGAARILALEAWPNNSSVDAVAVHRELEAVVGVVAPYGAHPMRAGTPDAIAKLANLSYHWLPELTTDATLQSLLPQMTASALSERLAALKIRASDPQDAFVGSVARRDLLALSATPVQMMAFGPSGTQQQGLVTVHPDGQHALISLEVDFDAATMSRTNPLMEALDAHVADAATRGVHLEVIGGYRHFRDNISTVKHDLFASLPLSTLLIALLLWSLLRSVTATAVIHVPALFSMLGAVGAVVLSGRELPIPMLGFAACVLGVAVDYGTHRVIALRAGEDIRQPLIFSYITTAAAFAVLLFSDVPAMQCIGLLVIGGLTLSLFSTLWLLPTLIPAAALTQYKGDPWEPMSGRVLRWCTQHSRLNLMVAVVLTVLLMPGLWQIKVVEDIRRLDGSRPGAWAALDAFMGRWGKLESSDYLVTTDKTMDGALDKLAQSRTRLGLAPTMVEVLLPSVAEQQRRRVQWNTFWTTNGPQFATNLEAACREQKLRFSGFALCLERYAPIDVNKREDVTFSGWNETPVYARLASFVQETKGGWRVASTLPNNDDPLQHRLSINNPELRLLSERAEALDTGAWVAIRSRIGVYLVEVVQRDLGKRGIYIGMVLLVVVALLMRNVNRTIGVFLPPAVALIWTFGLMGWFHIEFTPFTVLGAAFIGGIGIDSAIFLSQPDRRATALSPVMAATLTTVAGVSTLLLANHPMIFSIGQTLFIGMTASLFACLLITPSIVRD
jgi:uncharacterized protein